MAWAAGQTKEIGHCVGNPWAYRQPVKQFWFYALRLFHESYYLLTVFIKHLKDTDEIFVVFNHFARRSHDKSKTWGYNT